VIPLAVQEWKYEQKSYQVRRNYRIKTKEIDWEVSIIVISTEAEAAGQGRKWFVNLAQSYAPNEAKQLTKFGAGMSWLRLHAKAELSKWIARLNGGAALPSVKDRDKTDWDKRFGDDYLAKRDLIYKLFEDNTAGRFQQFNILGQAGEVGNWAEKGDKYRVYIPFRFPLHKTPGPQPSYFVDAYAVFETVKGGINLEQVDPMAPPDVEMLNFVVTGITPAVVPPQGKGGPMTP
jgi:hypothetical protein